MVLQNNLVANNAWRNVNINNGQIAKNLEKLSSGYRVNRAADDAAGLAISEKMRTQIRGLARASYNCLDGVSLIQTAEGALAGTHAILQRMRELAVQASNGTNDDPVDRAAIDLEFRQLMQEIDDIADITNFNGIYVLKGDYARGPEFEKTNIQETSINITHLLGSFLPNAAGGVMTTTVDVGGRDVDFRFTLNSNGTVRIRASHAGKILGETTIGQPSLEILWQWAYGGEGNDFASGIARLNNGNFVVVGEAGRPGGGDIVGYSGGNNDMWSFVINPNNGRMVSGTNNVGASTGYADWTLAASATDDGGYVIVGRQGGAPRGAYIIRYDANNNVNWERMIASAQCSHYENVVTLPNDAGFIAVGIGGPDMSTRFVTHYDRNGVEQWTETIRTSPIGGFDRTQTLALAGGNPLVLHWDNTVTMFDTSNSDSQTLWDLSDISDQIQAETGQSVLFDTITHLTGDHYLLTGGDGFVAKVTLTGNVGDTPSNATLEYYNRFEGVTIRTAKTGFDFSAGAITLGGSSGGVGYLARIVDTGSGFDMTWNLPFGNSGNDVVNDFYQTSANGWIVVGQTNSSEPNRTDANTFASQHAWVASVGLDPNRNSLEGISEAPMSLYDIGGRGWNISFDSVIVNLDPDRVERGVSTGFVDDIAIIATLETWDEEPAEPWDGLILQTGANEGDILRVYLESMSSTSLGLRGVNTELQEDASRAITYVHEAINKVSLHRAYLGAMQNRLEFKINNLDNSVENLAHAESRIRDADIAKEMTGFVKNNILIQSSNAMLAQANGIPNAILQLLG